MKLLHKGVLKFFQGGYEKFSLGVLKFFQGGVLKFFHIIINIYNK